MYRVAGSPRWGSAAVFIATTPRAMPWAGVAPAPLGLPNKNMLERNRLTAAATPRASKRIATPSRWGAAVVCAATKPRALPWAGVAPAPLGLPYANILSAIV
ncbi:hypothetical protein Mal33_38560 [Rosistilla oblonga]|uniref:Uncharacterized protein n=1 Tax=Rosistilla oblonga TaxID=2527990 RepID=A0A518IXN1_9BACT|nr:hypothetical protein Mal33_38560 [Rosistilla oblonga]